LNPARKIEEYSVLHYKTSRMSVTLTIIEKNAKVLRDAIDSLAGRA
jgi:hypothetical protein